MLRLYRCPSSLPAPGANAPPHSPAHTPASRWLQAPSHLHSHSPAALAQTTALARLKVTDSPPSFSSRFQSSAPLPTCLGVPPLSLAAIPPRPHWLAFSIPPFLLAFRSFLLSLHRSFVAFPASLRVKAGLPSEIWLPIGRSLKMLDHRVGGTQRFHNLSHKMATKVEAAEKGIREMTGRLTQTDT